MPSDEPRCPRCGAAIYQTRIGSSEGPVTGLTCWRCGWWADVGTDPYRMQRSVPKRLDERVPCKVQGCPNMVQVSVTREGFCHECVRKMRDWERSAKTKPAPLIQVMGRWIFNPERQRS
jgi:hypothetical protein